MRKHECKSWADLCEKLIDRLDALGEPTTEFCAEFGVLLTDCCMKGCGAYLKPKEGNKDA